MDFLMVSQSGEGAGVLKQIADEGNNCKLYINDNDYGTVYDGILDKVDEINPDENTVILFDMSGNGDIADDLKREGYLVYGASGFADDLEKDRQFGLSVMEEVGIKLPLTEEFDDFEDIEDFLYTNDDKKFVFKPSGTMPTKLTYCSKDNDDLISYLKFVEDKYGKDIDSFVLQEFVEGSVISSEIFFDGKKIILPGNHTVEVKKFMNDELGPSTGCSGNLVWINEDSKIIRDGVMKIEDVLLGENYVGQIDLNAVVNEKGIWGLEWTPRFGYDSIPTYLRMIGMEAGKFFSDIVHGTLKDIKHNEEEMWGMRLTIPPYPAEPEGDPEDLSPNVGVPIQNWETYNKNLYLYEVMLNEDEMLVHSGGTGVVACVVHKNPKRCYEILEKINVPDKQYRTDLEKVLRKMQAGAEQYA